MTPNTSSDQPGITTAPWYRWYALAVLVLVFTSSHVDRQIMGILLEPIKHDLNASDTQMGFLIGLTFALFYATLGMPIAMLADRGNRRNIITWAITIWSGMTVLCGYAQSFAQLAITRIGVGIGEAGSSPPSHSMISDMFPMRQRGTAMGIYALGVNLGLLIAYLAGGWMSEHWGWRTTFIVVGLPGLAIALLTRFTVVEPKRGQQEAERKIPQAPPFNEVARYMWHTPATRHVVFGSALAGFVGYGMVLWLPAFFVRSHGLSQTEVGFTLALMTGVVGGTGTFLAGKLADVLSAKDQRWFAWVVTIGKRWTGTLSRLVFHDAGVCACFTDLSCSRFSGRILYGAYLCHGAEPGETRNALSCSRNFPFPVEYYWPRVGSASSGYCQRSASGSAWQRIPALCVNDFQPG